MSLEPPIEPMLAKPLTIDLDEVLEDVRYEPKWDGFRCIAFRTDGGVTLQGRGRSRSAGEPFVDLSYAFPELVASMSGQLAPGTVLDGEIVVIDDGRLDFALLAARLRPRSERASIARLAERTPATFLAFDVLAAPSDVRAEPFARRRSRLVDLALNWGAPLVLTPSTADRGVARHWFEHFEAAGVDGLIVKPTDGRYESGKRSQGKLKHRRTADVVVAGWRPQRATDGSQVVGSLLLGLHDRGGVLHYVGGSAAFTAQTRRDLMALLAPLSTDDHPWLGETNARVPGEASRWAPGKSWLPIRPELVAEVGYDQMEGDRFRHATAFVRWRPDRDPLSCGFDQLDRPSPARIETLLQS